MITVYHMRGARGIRILWTCEEMGLPYEVKTVSFGEKPPEFATLNPSGTIPVLVDGAVVIPESIAAMQYLTSRYGPTPLVVGADEPDFADYLQFIMLGEAGLAAPMSAVVGTRLIMQADSTGPVETMILDGFKRRLRLVERQLADGREFLVGGRLTLADISVTFPLGIASAVLKLGDDVIPPVVSDYRRRLYKREAFRRAGVHGG